MKPSGGLLRRAVRSWNAYKYRFVPWLAFSFSRRSVRVVRSQGGDDIIVDEAEVRRRLEALFGRILELEAANVEDAGRRALMDVCGFCVEKRRSSLEGGGTGVFAVARGGVPASNVVLQQPPEISLEDKSHEQWNMSLPHTPSSVTGTFFEKWCSIPPAFSLVESKQTSLPCLWINDCDANSVHMASNTLPRKVAAPRGSIVGMYPGTVYHPWEPVLLQSLRNPFMFRCADGFLVDGKDTGLSRALFRSCSARERVDAVPVADTSWLQAGGLAGMLGGRRDQPPPNRDDVSRWGDLHTRRLRNPLACGQYVNNHNRTHPANVAYQEAFLRADFPRRLRQLLPNVYFGTGAGPQAAKVVLLVALTDIRHGDELFSNYFTVVR